MSVWCNLNSDAPQREFDLPRHVFLTRFMTQGMGSNPIREQLADTACGVCRNRVLSSNLGGKAKRRAGVCVVLGAPDKFLLWK